MHWQDLALAVGAIFFIIVLIPTLVSKTEKPALWTSVGNSVVLAMMASVYFSLSLWFAAVTTIGSFLCWVILTVQTLRRRGVRHEV
jgi:predicted branched-subunit amino acid permease